MSTFLPVGARMLRTRSLSTALYLLFLPLLFGSVGMTWWLAHAAGQQSVDEVAAALGDAYAERIRHRVRAYLQEPQQVTRVNRLELALGNLDPRDPDSLRGRFGRQLQDFEHIAYLYYGTEAGETIGLQREPEGGFSISTLDEEGRFVTHAATPDFDLGALTQRAGRFEVRTRPWYRAAVEARETTWSDIYVWFGRDELCIDVVSPVYDESDELIGVLDAGYTLGLLSHFLEGMQLGQTGEAYIVDPSGRVVATSTGAALFVSEGDTVRRLVPTELGSPLTTFVAEGLSLDDPGARTETPVHPELGPVTVMVHPLGIDPRLSWTLVVAIPQSDFTGHFDRLTHQTLSLILAASLVTVLAVLVFVRRLSRPLRQLARAAGQVQVGQLDIELPTPTHDELGALTVAMGEMVKGLRERETIRDAFGRYVTQDVAEQVLADPEAMRLGGVRRRVTILMSDLRGFTARSNQLEPEALVQLLNEYLGEMSEVIVAHEGLIVEFIGDAILVLFGATGDREDDALRACRCAVEMQDRLDAFNQALDTRGKPRLHMGIGVHTGEVVVGNIGSEHRMKFGVVGDTVNTTARVESQTVGGQCLVSASTKAAIGDALPLGEAVSARVKGLSEPLVVHELLRSGAAPALPLPDIGPSTAAELFRMAHKVLSEESVPVVLSPTADGRLRAVSEGPLDPLEDVMVVLSDADGQPVEQLYCKVVAVDGRAPWEATLVLTAVAKAG